MPDWGVIIAAATVLAVVFGAGVVTGVVGLKGLARVWWTLRGGKGR